MAYFLLTVWRCEGQESNGTADVHNRLFESDKRIAKSLQSDIDILATLLWTRTYLKVSSLSVEDADRHDLLRSMCQPITSTWFSLLKQAFFPFLFFFSLAVVTTCICPHLSHIPMSFKVAGEHFMLYCGNEKCWWITFRYITGGFRSQGNRDRRGLLIFYAY